MGANYDSGNRRPVKSAQGRIETIDFNTDTAKIASEIYRNLRIKNKQIEFRDILISATTLQYNLPITTLKRLKRNYAGQPWKTQKWVREVMNRMYYPTPDGYCGDEDNGQTSAWYVFSAMGFYPVTPASDQYVLGAPLFKKITVKFENGKELVINAPENSAENKYIQSAKFNGKDYAKNYLSYSELMEGAVLDFKMTATPNKEKGIGEKDFPYSFSN